MTLTYIPLATTKTANSQSSDITFSNISGNYTDLLVVGNYGQGSGGATKFQLNGDTAGNYSWTVMAGYSTSTKASVRANSEGAGSIGPYYVGVNASLEANFIVHFLNYSNTTTNKTILSQYSDPDNEVNVTSNCWRSTAAVTSIKIYATTGTFLQDSTFTLYGIKAE